MTGTDKVDQDIFDKAFDENGFKFQYGTNTLSAWVKAGSGQFCIIDGSTDIEDGQWHHIVAVFKREPSCTTNDLLIYVDGVQESTTASSGTNMDADITNTGALDFSNPASRAQYVEGLVDEIRIYNYARTQSQIIEDMNAGHPVGGSPIGSALAHWKFDEGYGDTVYDSGTGGANGDLEGACPGAANCPSWTNDGKFGKGLLFDGTNDYIDIATFDPHTYNNFTISVWYKSTDATVSDDEYIFLHENIPSGGVTAVRFGPTDDASQTDKLRVSLKENVVTTNYYGTSDIVDQTWHYLAVVRVNGRVKLYVDGIEESDTVDEDANEPIAIDATAGPFIGYDPVDGNPVDGIVDEIKFYDAALTADQVKIDMNQGKAAVWGASSTDSSGAGTFDAANEYCPPRSAGTCTPPVGEWKFDEGTGTTSTYDTSGNDNTGTMNGSMTQDDWVPGKKGWALDFDGSNDYISTNNGNSVKGLTQTTIELWFNPSALDGTENNIYSEARNADGSYRLQLFINTDNQLYFGGRAPDSGSYTTWVDDSRSLSTNTWYHLAAVYDSISDVHHIYLNGQDASASVADVAFDNTNPETVPKIGSGPNGNDPFQGKIDDVKIYDYARTHAQIAWDYNRGGPIGWWKLDECQGTTANDSGSGGNNGTITIGAGGSEDTVGTCETASTAWGNGATGKRNASIDLDGTDDEVQITGLLGTPTNITITGWANLITADSNGSELISVGNYVAIRLDAIWGGGRTLGFYYDGISYKNVTTGLDYEGTGWHHFAYVVDDDNDSQKIYIDGNERGESTHTLPISYTGSGSNTFLGTHGNASPDYEFDGQIDEAKVFNYALTQQQIRDEYNSGAVSFGP